jgi:diguanylate cyclase (GGDEF)-like protein
MSDPTTSSRPEAPLRVLVLDDEEAIRQLVRHLLVRHGCVVDTAEHGRAALQTLLKQDFDVVVVDMRMREMDGITFIQEARKIWPWLGFVILTGHADEEVLARAAALGIRRVLRKPMEAGRLWQDVQDEVKERRQSRSGSHPATPIESQNQLHILGRLTESAIDSDTLVTALQRFSDGLAKVLSCELVGIFGIEENEQVLILTSHTAVTQGVLDQAGAEILGRYNAISGHQLLREQVRTQIEGMPPSAQGLTSLPHSLLVPVMVHGDIQGLLFLAGTSEEILSEMNISFLYQAANLLSTVMSSVHRMRQMAVRDGLTGVYNRAFLEDVLERTCGLGRRHGYFTGVAIMDVDHFKLLNDSHGHLVGDQILREFAQVLSRVSRKTDILARYGGDEFVLLMPQMELPQGLVVGRRILEAVTSHVFGADNLRLKLTTSVGLATTREMETPASGNELLRRADQALYAAKREGRNRVCVWPTLRDEEAAPAAPAPAPTTPAVEEAAAPTRGQVLVVDDDQSVCLYLARLLTRHGCKVATDTSVTQALLRIRQSPALDLVITDLSLQEATGLSLLQEIQALNPRLMRIVLTGFGTKENAVASLRHGAFDFIEKPINPEEFLAIVDRALEHRRLLLENERYRERLEEMVREKSQALLGALAEVKQSHTFTLEAMAALLDARERTIGQHSQRVRDMVLLLGRELDLPPKELEDLGHSALLHDIGKIAVPDAILLKPGPLTPEEWVVMRSHAEVGYNILRGSPYLASVAECVYSHQERYDGTGYPRGLQGEQICLGARVFAVIDAYDAMRSPRVYRRKTLSPEEALAECQRQSGTQFDPRVVDLLTRCQAEIEQRGRWEEL